MTVYASSADEIHESQLARGFFADWPVKPTSERHLTILRRSYAVEFALHRDQVIGFATAISDGVMSAYIPLLEVLP